MPKTTLRPFAYVSNKARGWEKAIILFLSLLASKGSVAPFEDLESAWGRFKGKSGFAHMHIGKSQNCG